MSNPLQHEDTQLSGEFTHSFFSQTSSSLNLKSFWGRFLHFQRVVDPRNFIVSQAQLDQSKAMVAALKQEEIKLGKPLRMSKSEYDSLQKSLSIVSSAFSPDTGEQIPKLMRMCAFVPANIPILFGMLISSPTVANTIFWQWFNQSFNAGLNYGNRNASSNYTNQDLGFGYGAAVGSSVTVALLLRKLFSGMTARVTGSKLIIINSLVASIASGSAGFLNSYCMRQREMTNGISVFGDENMTQKLGISRICAKKAVLETATSRVFLSIGCLCSPAVIFYIFERFGKYPKNPVLRIPFEISVFLLALLGALPLSIAIFPQTGTLDFQSIENELQKEIHQSQDGDKVKTVYYSKGL